MTITVRKAGEAAAKAVVKAGSSATSKVPAAAAPTAVSQVVNRHVSIEEAPYVTPARESTKVSLMPWRGWFQRWLKEQIGEERLQYLRKATMFWPDDIFPLGSPYPSDKVPISNDDPNMTAMYRYPSPGSTEPPVLPEFADNSDPYDSGYFKRDTRRRYLNPEGEYGVDPHMERLQLMQFDPNDPAVKEELEKIEAGPQSSPGNGGVFATGPTSFDPTGLRATMSVNWKSYQESLDEHMPDHLPTPVWWHRQEEAMKHYEDRGMTPPVGDYYDDLKMPVHERVASW